MVCAWGVCSDSVTVIVNGVEKELLGLPAPGPRPEGKPLRVLFVGRMTNWKGIETLLLAMKELLELRLQLVGEGPEWPMIEALIRQLRLQDRVEAMGKLPRSKVSETMGASDILVLTSLYEGMSHTLLEAQAHGLPCIASDCGGNNEVVIDGLTGFLVPPQNPAALAHALRALGDDESLRRRMSVAARERAQSFRLSDSVREIVGWLDKIA